ncbi:hypothetical protein T492DRAFT_918953, partial [Pavlovales sp. CCMP2436]
PSVTANHSPATRLQEDPSAPLVVRHARLHSPLLSAAEEDPSAQLVVRHARLHSPLLSGV